MKETTEYWNSKRRYVATKAATIIIILHVLCLAEINEAYDGGGHN